MEGAGMLAWQGNSNDTKSTEIILLDLESKKKVKIESEEKERILLVGNIDNNLVYGLAREADVAEKEDGTNFAPMYKICIVNQEGNVLKEYRENNIFVEKAEIKENVVKMERVKKIGGVYKKTKPDSIQNRSSDEAKEMGVNTRVTELTLTEYYIYLRSNFKMQELPNVLDVKTTVMTESRVVRLDGNESTIPRYYVMQKALSKVLMEVREKQSMKRKMPWV